METTDPEFWIELSTKGRTRDLVDSKEDIPEDLVEDDEPTEPGPGDERELVIEDDSNLTNEEVINHIMGRPSARVGTADNGALKSTALAEDGEANFEDNVDATPRSEDPEPANKDDPASDSEIVAVGTRRKRQRKQNTLYRDFWRHDDADASDVEGYS